MKDWRILGLLTLLILGFLLFSGCSTTGSTSTVPPATPAPQIVYVTETPKPQVVSTLVTLTPVVVVPIVTEPTVSQDAKMDESFLTYINHNQIIAGMITLLYSNKGEYSVAAGYNTEPKKEAGRLTALLNQAPLAGSEKMKVFRSAMIKALVMMDGSTAGFTRYADLMETVIDTGEAAISGSSASRSLSQQIFSGTGDNTHSFSVTDGGGFLVTGSYTGAYNFIVNIVDRNGKIEERVFNENGSYSGKKIIHLDPGTHYLEVQAIYSWIVTITPT